MNDEARTGNGPEGADERLHRSDLPEGERPCLVARSRSREGRPSEPEAPRAGPLTIDADDDGYLDFEDCNDSAPTAWAQPGETRNVRVAADRTTLNWDAPTDTGGSFTFYDTLRTTTSSNFNAATCVESDGGDTATSDGARPGAGQVYFYLTRADNLCPGDGPLGDRSDGTPRSGRACP